MGFFCRRVVKVAASSKSVSLPKTVGPVHQKHLARIESTPGAATEIAKLPFWSLNFNTSQPFFNETSMSAIKRAGVSGLIESVPPGFTGKENIKPFWFSELQN